MEAIASDVTVKLSMLKNSFKSTRDELANIVNIKGKILDIKAEQVYGEVSKSETSNELRQASGKMNDNKLSTLTTINDGLVFFNEDDYFNIKNIAEELSNGIKEYKTYKSNFNSVEIEDSFETEIKKDDKKFLTLVKNANQFLSKMGEINEKINYINSKKSLINEIASRLDIASLDKVLVLSNKDIELFT
jgi:cell division protein ZapA (FtsZ GTPase activity inhibitor)